MKLPGSYTGFLAGFRLIAIAIFEPNGAHAADRFCVAETYNLLTWQPPQLPGGPVSVY